MPDDALLLAETPSLTDDAHRVAAVLRFFGIASRYVAGSKSLVDEAKRGGAANKARLICSAKSFLELVEESERSSLQDRFWSEHFHSIFIFSGSDLTWASQLVCRLCSQPATAVNAKVASASGPWCISEAVSWFCGPMSGLKVQTAEGGPGLAFQQTVSNFTPIIATGEANAFFKIQYQGVPVFISCSPTVINPEAELSKQNFDVRDHFLSAVPLVMYIKWAFAGSCWESPERNACLVIDDPLLKSRYGFIRFRRLLDLMEQHQFSTNIAFIPWNWRRSTSEVAQLFKAYPEKYSLSVHGCDHTAGEFGSSDLGWLTFKVDQAVDRMKRHQARTGVAHGQIMVFPQGVFSRASTEALKRANFLAAVNTEIFSADREKASIKFSDVWDVALMGYNSFPIFTRRYPGQGVENFAFDLLLGKPCIIVIHHDFCHDECRSLVEFIAKLNSLNGAVTWRSLDELVRRSSRQREVEPDLVEVEMYGNELRLNNRAQRSKRFLIRKREGDEEAIREITVASRPVRWSKAEGYVIFEAVLAGGEEGIVRVIYHEATTNGPSTEKLSYHVKTMVRRYLSEARDNYIVPGKSRLARMFKPSGAR